MVANAQTNEPELNIVQPSLALKMVRIMAAVGNIAKAGRNDFQKYNFIQSDDVLDAVRTEMIKNNVVIIPRVLSYEMSAETKGFHAVVQFEFTLIDADSGETFSAAWYGEASDSSDKSFSKAGTSALKYWLLKTFMISAGEPDADKEGMEHEHAQHSAKSSLAGNGSKSRRMASNSSADASAATSGQNGSNDAQTAKSRFTGNGGTQRTLTPQPAGKVGYHDGDLMNAVLKPVYGNNPIHMKKSLKKLMDTGALNPVTMTLEQAIEIVTHRHDADEPAK